MDLLNNGYYNSQAVQVLNAVEYDEFDNPIGLYESPSDPSSCNFTVTDNSRCRFVGSNCFQQQVSTCYMTVTGLLATDTVTVFGSSAVPVLSAGRMDFVVDSKYYGISIFRSAVLWAYYPMCESIVNPAGHIYHDCSGNGNHATLINGTVGNEGKQNEFHYLQKGFNLNTLSNGTSDLLNTGIAPTVNTKITIWGRVSSFPNTENFIFGAQGSLYRMLFGIVSGKWFGEFGGTKITTNTNADTNYHKFEFDKNYVKVDDVTVTTFTNSAIEPVSPVYIFARSAVVYGINFTSMEVNRILIEENSVPIRDFISHGSYFIDTVNLITYMSSYYKNIPFGTTKMPKLLTSDLDVYSRTLDYIQDTKSFLPSGCYLQQYSTNTNLKAADSTVGLWYGPEGDPYKVSYSTLCLQDPWNEQVFIGNKTKDYKLGPISTHKNNLTTVQKLTERVVRNVVDDALIEDPAFSHDVTVAAGDLTYSLYNAAGYTMNGIIDWGDGTTQSVNTSTTQTITKAYGVAGTYTVRFTGVMQYLSPYTGAGSVRTTSDKIIKINNWGNCNIRLIRLQYCSNLTSIPNTPITGLSTTNVNITNAFYGCTKLVATIPDNFLQFATVAVTLESLFYGCTSLTGQIPENLFRYCPNLTSVQSAFSRCIGLTGQMPEDLLKYNTKLTNAAALFYGCTNLSGSIPADLFKYNTEITTFAAGDNGIFSGCSGLTGSIPESLFRYNTKATNFDHTFYGCTNLTGNIPEDLFRYNSEMQIASAIFHGCSKLTGSIPANLFRYNTKITRLGYGDRGCFYNCIGLTGTIPATLFDSLLVCTQFTSVFLNCTGLTAIPINLFKYNTAVVQMDRVFESCTGITSIPTGLFDYNTNVTTFASTFRNTRITTIPSNLFTNNTKVTSFSYTFATNPSLAAIPSNLFDTNTLVTTFDNVFNGCTGITSIPTDLFRYNVAVTNMSYVFNNTRMTSIPVDIFRYNTLVTTFAYTFANNYLGLSNALTIPTDLFRYNVSATDFSYIFKDCNVTGGGGITSNLFQYNVNATTFYGVFYRSGLTSIPADLLKYNTKLTTIAYMFGRNKITSIPVDLFRYNTLLINIIGLFDENGYSLTEIPADTFRYNTEIISFEGVFAQCGSVILPEDLFYYNTKVVTYANTFKLSRNIVLPTRLFNVANLGKVTTWQNFLNVTLTTYSPTGTIQKIWSTTEGGDVTYTVQPTKTDAFNNCTALSNYAEIPVAWT